MYLRPYPGLRRCNIPLVSPCQCRHLLPAPPLLSGARVRVRARARAGAAAAAAEACQSRQLQVRWRDSSERARGALLPPGASRCGGTTAGCGATGGEVYVRAG